MKISANSPESYINQVSEDRKKAMSILRQTILNHLPEGFEETMCYGMIGYVVPKSIYPAGYHCDPKLPLPFMQIASQKNFIALYHLGIYADKQLADWFINEYVKQNKTKPDMGKSCIRFKKPAQIPLELIAELTKKISVQQWINLYEAIIKKKLN